MRLRKDVYEKYVRTVGPGQVLFREGDPGREMFIIIDGEVEITKRTSRMTEKSLIVLRNGDIFGEMSLVEKKSRSATATAVRASKLLVMNEALFLSMVRTNPDFAVRMITILSERIRRSNILIQDLMTSNRENQVLVGVVEYARKFGTQNFKGWTVGIPQFADWAAKHLGFSREEVPGVIASLVEKKHLSPSAGGKDEVLLEKSKRFV